MVSGVAASHPEREGLPFRTDGVLESRRHRLYATPLLYGTGDCKGEIKMNPPQTTLWLGESAQTLYRHMSAGLNGVRCGFNLGPWTTIRIALSWEDVTCQECIATKRPNEPRAIMIDTRGD